MSHYIVGLTGGIGSGKTTVSNEFAKLNIEIIDADVVARQVVEPKTPALTKIVQRFGEDILLDDGCLNRAKLRELIFANDSDKEWLNSLLHPLIRQEMLIQLEQASSPYCLLSAPLLFENNLHKLVNRSLVIDIDQQIQINRTAKRDNVSEEQVEAIINSQIEREKRLELADDVIDNSTLSFSDIQEKVANLHRVYLELATPES